MEEKRKLTRAEKNIKWIEKNLHFPDGPKIGQKFILAEFQRKWMFQIFDGEVPLSEVILTIPRKNAKTTLIACILLLYLCGPEAVRNTQLYSCAQVRKQATVIYDIVLKMTAMNPGFKNVLRPVKSQKQIFCDRYGIKFEALSNDASGQYGTNPFLVIFDEIGQTKGPMDRQYEAMSTGRGVQTKSLFILISTQAAKPNYFFSEKIREFRTSPKPDQLLLIHECPEDHPDPFSEDAIRQANPAYDEFLNKQLLLDWAERAKTNPREESGYRNYCLNQMVDTESPFLTRSIWQKNIGDIEDIAGKDVYIGVDLSRRSDLTGMVAMYKNSDGSSYSLKPYTYLPSEGLREKSERDRTDWIGWAKQGMLQATPGSDVDYKFVVADIKKIEAVANIVKIAIDPYNSSYFKMALFEAGYTEKWIEDKLFMFRQGAISMHPGVVELEILFNRGAIRTSNHPVLQECFSNAKVVEDSAENLKFEKMADHRKKDLADCSAMAAALMRNYEANKVNEKPKQTYRVFSI